MMGEISSFMLRYRIGVIFQIFRNVPLFDIISVMKKIKKYIANFRCI